MITFLLFLALFQQPAKTTVNIYIEQRIVEYMTERGTGRYETVMREATPSGYGYMHRDYLRWKPKKGDVVIELPYDVAARLASLLDTRDDDEAFDAALKKARPLTKMELRELKRLGS